MINYVYISATKVNTLYPQIPKSLWRGIEGAFELSASIFKASIKGTVPRVAEERVMQAKAVYDQLNRDDVIGNLTDPKEWIEGTARLRWGLLTTNGNDFAFFGGSITTDCGKKLTLALIGSSEGLLGGKPSERDSHGIHRYIAGMYDSSGDNNEQATYFEEHRKDASAGILSESQVGLCIQDALKRVKDFDRTGKEFHFVAKVIEIAPGVILATPLYVSVL